MLVNLNENFRRGIGNVNYNMADDYGNFLIVLDEKLIALLTTCQPCLVEICIVRQIPRPRDGYILIGVL